MSENDIKPVAWQYKNGKRWETVSENTYTVYCVGRERRSLYNQVTIDRLTAERDDALAAADSKAGWEWMRRAEKAEAERDAAVADAERYRAVIEYALAQHNGQHADHNNHWAAKAMNELASIDAAHAKER